MASFRFVSPKSNVNLWVVPLKMSLAAVLLFAITIPDMLDAYHVIHIPAWFSMAASTMRVRSSVRCWTASVQCWLSFFQSRSWSYRWVANLFGPRLLYRFVQDWVTQTCIGIFMGAFIYVFLVTHQDQHGSFIPQVSLITSWFLVLGAFGFLVFYSHRVAVLIQHPDAIGRIVDDLRRAAEVASRDNRGEPRMDVVAPFGSHIQATDSAPVLSSTSGYLQEIDHPALASAASKAGR